MSHRNPIRITVEKLVYGGDGLSRTDGRVLLTPFVLPGETALVDPIDKLRASLIEVVEPSPERIPAPCPYFGNCGGCHYQHTTYERQLQYKVEILREVFRRVGKFDAPEQIAIHSGEPWGYRNRSQFHADGRRVGYLKQGSHELVPIDHCPISSPRLNEALQAIIKMAKDTKFPSFLKEFELFTNERDVQLNVISADRPLARYFFDWCAQTIPGYVDGALTYENFRVSHKSFFQVNRFLIDKLVDIALEPAAGQYALELYAGVGLFTRALLKRFNKVVAVESGRAAVADLEANVPDAKAQRASADDFLAAETETPDFVLADPPRAGLTNRATQQLLRLQPKKICMVSCDVSTCARDIAKIIAAGYRIEKTAMVDLFPQTYHMETVVHLSREIG